MSDRCQADHFNSQFGISHVGNSGPKFQRWNFFGKATEAPTPRRPRGWKTSTGTRGIRDSGPAARAWSGWSWADLPHNAGTGSCTQGTEREIARLTRRRRKRSSDTPNRENGRKGGPTAFLRRLAGCRCTRTAGNRVRRRLVTPPCPFAAYRLRFFLVVQPIARHVQQTAGHRPAIEQVLVAASHELPA